MTATEKIKTTECRDCEYNYTPGLSLQFISGKWVTLCFRCWNTKYANTVTAYHGS